MMSRALHIGLLLMALVGLSGPSAAMAIAPSSMASMTVAQGDPSCAKMMGAPKSPQVPCKKMTADCMVAMGCVPLALAEPGGIERHPPSIIRDRIVPSPAARLSDRSFGPEPDPPSFLI